MKLQKSEFLRAVMVLTSGTVLAQLVSYLIAPILTRIYSTEEMGDLGLYLRGVAFISALATARYELSIPLAKNELHSYILYRLSLRIAVYMLMACGVIGIVYLFIVPFSWFDIVMVASIITSSFFMVLVNLGTNWSIRHNQFRKIAFSKISNSLSSNGLRWLFGVFNFGSKGLLIASLIGHFISSLTFVKELFVQTKKKKGLLSQKKMFVLSREYKDFPFVSLPHVLIDLGRDLLIAALMVAIFSKHIYGSYNHSYTILRIPLMVIGASIGQVFYNRCATMVNEGKTIYPLIKKALLLLFLLSIPPFSLIFFFGEELFGFVFGETWRMSGKYSEIMSIWLMLNFIISPLSGIPMILKRQREYFFIGLMGTLIQLVGFAIIPFLFGKEINFEKILSFVSIGMVINHAIVIVLTLYFSRNSQKKIR